MNVKIKIIIIIFIILVVSLMLYKIINELNSNKIFKEDINKLPDFEFVKLPEECSFTENELKLTCSLLIVYFNTECNLCKFKIEQINNHIDKFKDFQVLLVSIEEPDILKQYFKTSDLLNRDFIYILYDKDMQFERVFGRCPFPTSFIYNRNKELVKIFKGEVKVEALLKYLNM